MSYGAEGLKYKTCLKIFANNEKFKIRNQNSTSYPMGTGDSFPGGKPAGE
jgi:hypothetical protein